MEMPYTHDMYADDIEYHEELAILKAQEHISELMEEKGITKAELARKLGKSKAFVTRLLSDGHNMTVKTLAQVHFCLREELIFKSDPIQREPAADLFQFPVVPKINFKNSFPQIKEMLSA